MCGIAYYILVRKLIAANGQDSVFATVMGKDTKGILSVVIYVVGIAVTWINPAVACGLYVSVGLMWLIPDRRVERHLTSDSGS